MLITLFYLSGGIVAVMILIALLAGRDKVMEDQCGNSVIYVFGFILSWLTLFIILIVLLEYKNNRKK